MSRREVTFLAPAPGAGHRVERSGWYVAERDRPVAGPFRSEGAAARWVDVVPSFRDRALATPCPVHGSDCSAVGVDRRRRVTFTCGRREYLGEG